MARELLDRLGRQAGISIIQHEIAKWRKACHSDFLAFCCS
jgi:hypothetical protein